jgi:hypothetical protein
MNATIMPGLNYLSTPDKDNFQREKELYYQGAIPSSTLKYEISVPVGTIRSIIDLTSLNVLRYYY